MFEMVVTSLKFALFSESKDYKMQRLRMVLWLRGCVQKNFKIRCTLSSSRHTLSYCCRSSRMVVASVFYLPNTQYLYCTPCVEKVLHNISVYIVHYGPRRERQCRLLYLCQNFTA